MEKSVYFKEVTWKLPPPPFTLTSFPIDLELIKKFSIFLFDKAGLVRYIVYFNDTFPKSKTLTLKIIIKSFRERNVKTLQALN